MRVSDIRQHREAGNKQQMDTEAKSAPVSKRNIDATESRHSAVLKKALIEHSSIF